MVEEDLLFTIASAALALQILAHCLIIFWLPSSGRSAVIALIFGLGVSILCGLNALGIGFEQEFRPYLVGVLWHVLQAGGLFISLVWVRSEDVRSGESDPQEAGAATSE